MKDLMNSVHGLLIVCVLGAGCGSGAISASRRAVSPPDDPADSASRQLSSTEVGHPLFESPHSNPIVVTGGLVFVVNTPADTVDVINANSQAIITRINVGIDPVGLGVRPDGNEVWVSNHVSDSVNVIDTDRDSPTFLQVVATVQDIDPVTKATRFDEPVGVTFASNEKAYVALSSENQIAVVDVATRHVTSRLDITAQDPRAIMVRGDRLYVIPFESGNQTQSSGAIEVVSGRILPPFTYDVLENRDNPLEYVHSLYQVVDIIKNPELPDRDLFVFDTATDQLIETVDSLGTLLYGMTVDSTGRVFVAQTDARNAVNGLAGTARHSLVELENRPYLNRITVVDFSRGSASSPRFIDIEPLPPVHPGRGRALATPFGIQISEDDSTLVVTAAHSDTLFTIDTSTGEVLGRTRVKRTPRGVALVSGAGGQPLQAWVFNALDNSVTLVDVSVPANPEKVTLISLEDPTPRLVRRRRIKFNYSRQSTTKTFTCASCHPDGHTDQLLWVLEPPIYELGGTQIQPRTTKPIRALRDTAPYHWDGIHGDPFGGNNGANVLANDLPSCDSSDPVNCARILVDAAQASTMTAEDDPMVNDEGLPGALDGHYRDAVAAFLLSVSYPPARERAYTNELSDVAKRGFRKFHIDGEGPPNNRVCGDCHSMPFWAGTGASDSGMDAPTWRGANDRWLLFSHGKEQTFDMLSLLHPRAVESGMPEREIWDLAPGAAMADAWHMVQEGSTGFSGSFARQFTLNQATAGDELTGELLDALEESASEGAIVLQGEGVFIDRSRATTPVALEFVSEFMGGTYVWIAEDPVPFTRRELVALASTGEFICTFTARSVVNVDRIEHPQPALWVGEFMVEGRQEFPTLSEGDTTLVIQGRHIEEGARVIVDGRRVTGSVSCQRPDCLNETIVVELAASPPRGIHFLQVQNPAGLFSNDFIFFVE